MGAAEHRAVTFRLELSDSVKPRGSEAMRLPEAQVAHGVPGAIHGFPRVSVPDGLRHDSCTPRDCAGKRAAPSSPSNADAGGGGGGEAAKQFSVLSAARQRSAPCRPSQGQKPLSGWSSAEGPLTSCANKAHSHPRPTRCTLQMRKLSRAIWAPFIKLPKWLWGPKLGP